MKRLTPCLLLRVLPILVIGLIGCGSNRQLQSVMLNPPVADAQTFPGGQVSFAATGTFSKPPSPVTLTGKDVTWCAGSNIGMCVGNINPGFTVDQNGVAQCVPGFKGTATVLAGVASSSVMNPDGGMQLKIFGSAQLTCP